MIPWPDFPPRRCDRCGSDCRNLGDCADRCCARLEMETGRCLGWGRTRHICNADGTGAFSWRGVMRFWGF